MRRVRGRTVSTQTNNLPSSFGAESKDRARDREKPAKRTRWAKSNITTLKQPQLNERLVLTYVMVSTIGEEAGRCFAVWLLMRIQRL
ncbi:hypothetical protein Dda_5196 [Drechslerella dactyloides]|uniref:Uncharacterized protein n=1 Tax=Drechslerella dactyloides TaxID=74499 RepID=A0AAD6IVR8_DREDA|nr:hypothetical protein Dda_5196 [Drechslerella dactyloides]